MAQGLADAGPVVDGNTGAGRCYWWRTARLVGLCSRQWTLGGEGGGGGGGGGWGNGMKMDGPPPPLFINQLDN